MNRTFNSETPLPDDEVIGVLFFLWVGRLDTVADRLASAPAGRSLNLYSGAPASRGGPC